MTDRRLPDKAIDLIDEAAAKLRVAIYSMPPSLKEKKTQLDELVADEEEAWAERDYENAAQYKTDRVRLEEEYQRALTAPGATKHGLDDLVDAADIAEVVQSWTGIPVSSMLQAEAEKLLHMEDALRERIVGQEQAVEARSATPFVGRAAV